MQKETNNRFNYAPATIDNSPLSKYNLGDSVEKTVRTVNCIYYSESFQVYQVKLEVFF